ncbi:MAG: J domain-containing protein, partial [Isosphaeraceae bacterium]
MGFHSFSLDPRTVLGVGLEATLEEIHDAYRAKSKKHHPDLGGDEWAFRMVARAYEVLKTTAESRPDHRESAGAAAEGRPTGPWSWAAGPWSTRMGESPGAGAGAGFGGAGAGASAGHWPGFDEAASERVSSADASDASSAEPDPAAAPDPTRLREVDVELIWTRFEKDQPARLLAERDADDSTLSVCMVISWPEAGLVDQAAGYPGAAES